MSSPETQKKKLGDYAVRSNRNKWAEGIEELVRELSPFRITYDVGATQATNFSEYSYTEIAGGMWINTQSIELNARLIDFAAQQQSSNATSTINKLAKILDDKYVLATPKHVYRRVCFLPGQNMLDIASPEAIARLAHEEDDVMFKLHPITSENTTNMLAKKVGYNRIISPEISGLHLLKNCEEVYTSSASEMAITGTVLGKKVHNVSNFFCEGSGAYHVISRLLFKAHKQDVAAAQRVLANIIDCPWSGLLFPWHKDYEERIRAYFAKSLELRDLYKPLAAPQRPPQVKPKDAPKPEGDAEKDKQ